MQIVIKRGQRSKTSYKSGKNLQNPKNIKHKLMNVAKNESLRHSASLKTGSTKNSATKVNSEIQSNLRNDHLGSQRKLTTASKLGYSSRKSQFNFANASQIITNSINCKSRKLIQQPLVRQSMFHRFGTGLYHIRNGVAKKKFQSNRILTPSVSHSRCVKKRLADQNLRTSNLFFKKENKSNDTVENKSKIFDQGDNVSIISVGSSDSSGDSDSESSIFEFRLDQRQDRSPERLTNTIVAGDQANGNSQFRIKDKSKTKTGFFPFSNFHKKLMNLDDYCNKQDQNSKNLINVDGKRITPKWAWNRSPAKIGGSNLTIKSTIFEKNKALIKSRGRVRGRSERRRKVHIADEKKVFRILTRTMSRPFLRKSSLLDVERIRVSKDES